MALKLNEKYLAGFVDSSILESVTEESKSAFSKVVDETGEGSFFLGWKTLPLDYDKEEFARIKAAAEKIKKSCDIFIVIGIGGSYLGAKAAIDFLYGREYNDLADKKPKIYFAGNSINPEYLNSLLKLCEGKDVCVNVISKSGKTTEPAIAFRVFREYLEKKYGADEAKERIFVTTDKEKGGLHDLAVGKGYEMFVVPDNIGGRYSVLSAVGLLPIAVSGADIDKMMSGAKDAMDNLLSDTGEENAAVRYAVLRNVLYRSGKKIEILTSYDPALTLFAEWWKQLYGESEGKDGVGIYPASCIFSTDLHSLGQYIQEGERELFETVIDISSHISDISVPTDEDDSDGLGYIQGKSLSYINSTAYKATLVAHNEGGVPNIVIELDRRDEENFGYLVYFFELACAVSGYILGVNPFNQPGVEAYKNNMYALLGKTGAEFDEIRAKIADKI